MNSIDVIYLITEVVTQPLKVQNSNSIYVDEIPTKSEKNSLETSFLIDIYSSKSVDDRLNIFKALIQYNSLDINEKNLNGQTVLCLVLSFCCDCCCNFGESSCWSRIPLLRVLLQHPKIKVDRNFSSVSPFLPKVILSPLEIAISSHSLTSIKLLLQHYQLTEPHLFINKDSLFSLNHSKLTKGKTLIEILLDYSNFLHNGT
jgi:hypothetical protein